MARIIDGDTIECAGRIRVRLLLIDAPERTQHPYGGSATAALREMLPVASEARLELDVQVRDRYGRVLAYVYLPDGRMVNEELLLSGWAFVSVYPPNVKYVERMRAAAADARENGRGLWGIPSFQCAPQDHRRGRC